jgi:N-carbamoylputrescine amidase
MPAFTLAVTQFSCSWDQEANILKAESLVRKAAEAGANVVLLPELFAAPYFCKDKSDAHFALAAHVDESPLLERMAALAEETKTVLPVSFFEKDGDAYYNSIAMFDADGCFLGVYRKSHIPDGPGYWEKFYFSPGNTGFRVWETQYGAIGVGICWDQWFPEAARAMTLLGAAVMLYPTAIGSEPLNPALDTQPFWRRVMQGNAMANMVPIAAANRVGVEVGESCTSTFYGSSFITDAFGEIQVQADRSEETVLLATIDPEENARLRMDWGFFRDRRPEFYGALLSR